MWKWLALHAGGKHIEFVKDGYYSGNWDDAQRLLVLNAEGTLLESRERPHDPAQDLDTAQKTQGTSPSFTVPPA